MQEHVIQILYAHVYAGWDLIFWSNKQITDFHSDTYRNTEKKSDNRACWGGWGEKQILNVNLTTLFTLLIVNIGLEECIALKREQYIEEKCEMQKIFLFGISKVYTLICMHQYRNDFQNLLFKHLTRASF